MGFGLLRVCCVPLKMRTRCIGLVAGRKFSSFNISAAVAAQRFDVCMKRVNSHIVLVIRMVRCINRQPASVLRVEPSRQVASDCLKKEIVMTFQVNYPIIMGLAVPGCAVMKGRCEWVVCPVSFVTSAVLKTGDDRRIR